jgi:hypothetical protein
MSACGERKPLNADAVVNDLSLDNHALRGALKLANENQAILRYQNQALRAEVYRLRDVIDEVVSRLDLRTPIAETLPAERL